MSKIFDDPEQQPKSKSKKPGPRRLARELVLGLLFQGDFSTCQPELAILNFEKNFAPNTEDGENSLDIKEEDFNKAWPLAVELFSGVCRHLKEIDDEIRKAAENWSLERMSPVDRSLIRLAYYEMRYREDIPPRVSVNEALEISKNYGSHDSRSFINGVLDRLMRGLENKEN